MRRKRSARLNGIARLVRKGDGGGGGGGEDRKSLVLVFVCGFGVEICGKYTIVEGNHTI